MTTRYCFRASNAASDYRVWLARTGPLCDNCCCASLGDRQRLLTCASLGDGDPLFCRPYCESHPQKAGNCYRHYGYEQGRASVTMVCRGCDAFVACHD
jgi:hypothetical protein